MSWGRHFPQGHLILRLLKFSKNKPTFSSFFPLYKAVINTARTVQQTGNKRRDLDRFN